ncbi:hypothetical protein [Ornithinibacillus halotolerans]|uniref:Uncharacterized protein n=1 Tax=Ornithinibacillus halotolerans TaxID=1274357 RepID=A0A916S0C2_9BACI|nr:hypothetical protein [Ornithinibacillus halotolerans]GGA77880.1 hypothetical protein GCM10008025_21680 [Ornithinibacillus halotolerans]
MRRRLELLFNGVMKGEKEENKVRIPFHSSHEEKNRKDKSNKSPS